MRYDRREEQHIAIAWRFRGRFGPDQRARARLVLHDERLVEPLAELLSEDPGEVVVSAARRVRHDDADRFVRPRLRVARVRRKQRERSKQRRSGRSVMWVHAISFSHAMSAIMHALTRLSDASIHV